MQPVPSSSDSPPLEHLDDLGIFGLPGDVRPWDVRHDAEDVAFCEPIGDGRFRLRVWAQPELVDCSFVARDGSAILEYPMEPVSTKRFTVFEVVAGPFDHDVQYSFALRSDTGRPVYLTAAGVAGGIERLDRWSLVVDRPAVEVPSWGGIIYQIFPERFANGDPSIDPAGVVRWGSPPRAVEFQGGDLIGVRKNLDRLEWLGVRVIYLNPIFTSPSNHKYDTVDYFSVDPAFGGNEALADLVEAAHGRGIRVILDASFNHVHPSFFAFQDLIEHGPASRFAGWFVVKRWPLSIGVRPHLVDGDEHATWLERWPREVGVPLEELADDGPAVEPSYDSWTGVPTMPRLDLSHPEARRYALDVARYWVREFGTDGWRMDVARYIDDDFWDDFREEVRSEKEDAYLLAEVFGNASNWLQGNRFDATMNYTFRSICLRFLATEDMDGSEFLDEASRTVFQYAWPVTLASQNLIGSHDTPRFLTVAGGEAWRLRLATVLQMTMPGMPGIYYGDELEMTGENDPGCRGAYPADVDLAEHPTARMIRELALLRSELPDLVDGPWRPVDAGDDHVAFERGGILVVVNRGSSPIAIRDSRSHRWGSGASDGAGVEVAGRSAAIFA